MSHAITIGGLLLGLGAIVGLGFLAIGALAVFAGGMSDSPSAGESAGSQGCILFAIGAVLLIGSVLGMIL